MVHIASVSVVGPSEKVHKITTNGAWMAKEAMHRAVPSISKNLVECLLPPNTALANILP